MTYTEVKKAIQASDKDAVRKVLDDYNEEVLQAAIELDIPACDVAEAYQGEYKSDEDFVQQLLEDCGDLPKLPNYVYIDWERTASDVMMDYAESNGHYFRNL